MKRHDGLRQCLFWCAFLLYLVATTLQFTMATEVGMVGKILTLARYLSFGLAGLKILWDWALLGLKKEGPWSLTRGAVGCALKYILLAGIVLLAVVTSKDTLPLFVLVLLLASKGVEVDDIFGIALPVQEIGRASCRERV